MANQTVTTNLTIEQVISNGLNDGNNITCNVGALITFNVSPTVLIGQQTINDGEHLLDGANAGNPIVLVGEESEEINVNGAGILRATRGWWEFPTTGDGTASQTFDCSTYYVDAIVDSDVFSGVWVETGRRINYDGGSGIAPVVGDWVFAVADRDIHGRITEVSGDGVSGHIVVRFLTGALADNDAIELHTIQDNFGPDYQKSWNALANGVDVREAGTYQGFGNCHQNNTNYLAQMGSGMAGFAFQQAWQSNTLTFGDGTNGFIIPDGARIRVPMVHVCTGTIASVAINETVWPTSFANKYEIETQNGGDVYLDGVSFGSAHFEDALAGSFEAFYCAANHAFGSNAALSKTIYDNCIFVSSIQQDARSTSRSVPAVVDLVTGSLVSDCISIAMNDAGEVTQLGGQTSFGVRLERCIQIGNGVTNEIEFQRIVGVEIYDLVVIGTQLVFTTCSDIKVELLKTQRNINGSVAGADQVLTQSSCNNMVLSGWEILQLSCPDDSKIVVSDSTNVKVRGFHWIDDKFDNEALGLTQGEEFMWVSGFCSDVEVARCWQDRGSPNEFVFQLAGTSNNVTVLNCGGEYSGEIDPDGINIAYRGLHGGAGSLGASAGVETDYPGTNGAHFGDVFTSDTTGKIYYRNVPGNADYPITVLAGNPKFTKDGDVDVVLGDQWEVDMGYYALGHTGFTGVLTTTRNASAAGEGTDNWTGVDIDFQYDNGSGYNGVWLDLRTASNLTGIASMVGGLRMKLRFTGNSTQTNGQALTIHTATTLADQYANMYPIDQFEATLTLSGLVDDSDVVILQAGTNTVLASVDEGGTVYNYTYSTVQNIDIGIIKPGYVTQYIYGFSLTTTSTTLPVVQTIDRAYI